MASRVKSALWVSALLRRARAEAAFATVINKGEESAGAIFIVVSNMQGQVSLLGPAPQLFLDSDKASERHFEWLIQSGSEDEARARIEREKSFDPDIWVVEIEDREMRPFVQEIVETES